MKTDCEIRYKYNCINIKNLYILFLFVQKPSLDGFFIMKGVNIMAVFITIITCIIALILFILAENKEEVWSKVKFKDEKNNKDN